MLLCTALSNSFAQTFWTETFSNQASATTNWVHGGTNAGTDVWTWTNDPLAGFQNAAVPAFGAATATTGYFYFNSDGNGEGNAHDVTLTGVGVPANCTGKSNVRVRFSTQYFYAGADDAQLGVSTDGTNFTYTNLFTGLPAGAIFDDVLEVDISDIADGQAQVWLQFRYPATWEYHWKVDDIEMFEYVAPQRSVTFRVNTALLPAVDPAGMFLAGSFNNFSDEAMTNEGNGIWSITKSLTDGVQQFYKFKNGPNGWEPGQAACGVSDGFGGFNRTITPTADVVLPAVCFNECGVCVLPAVPCDQNPNAIICDDFDTYNPALRLGPQADWWDTWSGTEGGAEDGIVSTEQAFSAPHSLKLSSTAANGGPQDVMLLLENRTTGHYSLKWKMYVAAGKEGYYNIQNIYPIPTPAVYNLDVFFNANGSGNFQIGANPLAGSFTYPQGSWFDVEHDIDLDNNILRLKINGDIVKVMPFAGNLGGIDFYGATAISLYYVDNVEYVELPAVVFNADDCATSVDITATLGNAVGTVTNVGPFDITNAVVAATDPTTGFECHFDGDPLQGTHWFTFVGDGNTYQITSAACGASPIENNDTQFALYSGECNNWTALDCNDDIDVASNLSSRLTVTTEPGVTYYLMVDSYEGADGTYCLDVEQTSLIDCNSGAVGSFELLNDGFLCFGQNLNTLQVNDVPTWVIPPAGPVSGNIWCITAAPLDPSVWPGTIPGIASTTASPTVTLVGLLNDGTAFASGVYYLTPVVVSGGTLVDPAGLARIFNVNDPSTTGGCFFVGESQKLTLVPQLTELVAFESVTQNANGTVTIDLTVDGGLGAVLVDPTLYNYLWNNGATTASLNNVTPATYTVTISDPTGCVDDIVLTIASSVKDPASVKALTLSPNPTSGTVNLTLSLVNSADVQVDVVNMLGQVMQTLQLGKVSTTTQPINLHGVPSGTYTIRVRMDNETAVRRVAVQH
jgi:hypothetical protein